MLSPFAAAQASQYGQGPPGMGAAPGMAPGGPPNPLAGGQQQDPLAMLGGLGAMLPPNPYEGILNSTTSAGWLDGVGPSNSSQTGPLMDSVFQDQMTFPPPSETALTFDPRIMDLSGGLGQQGPGAGSLAQQLQQGASMPSGPAPQAGQMRPMQQPSATIGGGQGNSALLQALMGR